MDETTAVDVNALAESLAATAASLQAHIEARANEIAQREIAIVAEDCERRIAELHAELAVSEQRRVDVIAELHKALGHRDRQIDQQAARIAELKDVGEVIRRLEETPLRVDDVRRARYLTDADLLNAIYGGDPDRAESAVRRALPGMLAGLADRLEAK